MPARSARCAWKHEINCHNLLGQGSPSMEYGATALVTVVAWLLYWRTLDASFAYDDSRAIKTNQDLLPTTSVFSLFKNDFWGTPLTHSGSHKSYRPLCVLTFRLNHWLGGFDPWGYHLTNVILHSMVSAIFTKLASLVFLRSTVPTLVAGLLFAAHPVHTEAVAGVVGRADVGACLFFLLCIMCYIKYCDHRSNPLQYGRRWLYLILSLICAAFSMLTKEHGITVLAVCAVYEVLVYHKADLKEVVILPFKIIASLVKRAQSGTHAYPYFSKRFHGLREGLLHLLGVVIALLGLRLHLMGSKPPDFAPADNPAADSSSLLTRTLTFLYLPAFNFWMLLCPRWLSFDWSMEAIPLLTSILDIRNLYTLAFYVSLGIFTFRLLRVYNSRTINGIQNGAFVDGNAGFCPCMVMADKVTPNHHHHHHNNNNNNHHHRSHRRHSNNNHSSSNHSHHHHHHHHKNHNHNHNNNHNNNNHHNNNHHNSNNHNNNNNSNNEEKKNGLITFAWYTNGELPLRWFRRTPSPPSENGSAGNRHGFRFNNSKIIKSAFSSPDDVITFALALMILPFIPATNLFFYVGFVVAERVLYIPSMGFCLLVALGVDRLHRGQPRWLKRIVLFCFSVTLIILSLRTVVRNDDWHSEENLYRSGIPVNPPKAYGNLANILSGIGQKDEAEWAYRQALSYRANMADVRYNLGILLQEQERYEEALHSYRLAIQFRPRLAMAHLNMGLVLAVLGRKEEAAEVYRHCAELDGTGLKDPKMHESTRISALFNLGRLYADDGDYHQAVEVYLEAVRKMPPYYPPQSLYNVMGEAYFKMNQFEDAEHWYQEALRVKNNHIPAHLTYAKLLAKWARLDEAEHWFLRAKSIAPNDSSIYQHYGQFLSEFERHEEAADTFVQAAKLAADDYEIIFSAANTLRQAGRNIEAETYYQMAVKLRPNQVTSHMNLGAMLHVNGKLLEAEAAYLEALKLRPEDQITQNNLQKLRRLLVQKGLKPASSNTNSNSNNNYSDGDENNNNNHKDET